MVSVAWPVGVEVEAFAYVLELGCCETEVSLTGAAV